MLKRFLTWIGLTILGMVLFYGKVLFLDGGSGPEGSPGALSVDGTAYALEGCYLEVIVEDRGAWFQISGEHTGGEEEDIGLDQGIYLAGRIPPPVPSAAADLAGRELPLTATGDLDDTHVYFAGAGGVLGPRAGSAARVLEVSDDRARVALDIRCDEYNQDGYRSPVSRRVSGELTVPVLFERY